VKEFKLMIETSEKVEPIYPAATVVFLRDGSEGLEALLVQRSQAVKHMGGMWVFPGGKIDDGDRPHNGDDYEAAVNAAIRETSEEVGLTISAGQLVYLSHWTTPEGAKKRFSTWFFLAILDDGQAVQVDGGEIAHHRWVEPHVALAETTDDAQALRLMPPTFVSLKDIAPFNNCEEARVGISERDPIIYAPRMVFVEDGICFLYAGDAGYESESIDVLGAQHRFYMVAGQLEYVRRD
jgi:8-oxo-dGTP pyrophosphatase MutT (NUDIX family)